MNDQNEEDVIYRLSAESRAKWINSLTREQLPNAVNSFVFKPSSIIAIKALLYAEFGLYKDGSEWKYRD